MIWDVSREIFTVGNFALRWYSLFFALGIVIGYFIIISFYRRTGRDPALVDRLLMFVVIGTIVGARLGHCLLYEPLTYLNDPVRILMVWEGGLASHGGFTGVILALLLYTRLNPDIPFLWLADRMSITSMIAAGSIRIGNLFNSEIVGRPTDVPWAVVFKKVDDTPRHPSQIYEAIGYLAVAGILYGIYRLRGREPRAGLVLGWALILGFGYRFMIEFLKEVQVDFEQGLWLDMGQLLSLPFMLAGVALVLDLPARIQARRTLAAAAVQPVPAPETGGRGRPGKRRRHRT